jgi:hypothetical protein
MKKALHAPPKLCSSQKGLPIGSLDVTTTMWSLRIVRGSLDVTTTLHILESLRVSSYDLQEL